MPVLHEVQRWFSERRDALRAEQQRRDDARQRRRNEALWSVLNFDHGTRGVDRLAPRAIRRGADLNAVVPEGYDVVGGQRPIAWAVNAERWDLVCRMLEHGADPNSPGRSLLEWRVPAPIGQHRAGVGHDGPVPVFAVALLKVAYAMDDASTHPTIKAAMWRAIDAFLEHGADPSLRVAGTTGLDQVIMLTPKLRGWTLDRWSGERLKRLGVNLADEEGRTPLHWMVRHGSYEHREDIAGFRTLLTAGADPYAVNRVGDSPLHDLAEAVRCGDQHPMALTTINAAFPDLDWDRVNPLTGQTPWDVLQQPEAMARQDGMVYATALEQLRAHRIALEARILRATVAGAQADLDHGSMTTVAMSEACEGASPRRGRARL